jgi:hypothetical protein
MYLTDWFVPFLNSPMFNIAMKIQPIHHSNARIHENATYVPGNTVIAIPLLRTPAPTAFVQRRTSSSPDLEILKA